MRDWQLWAWKNTIHVAGRVFVEGAFIPSVIQALGSVPFAIQTGVAKRLKRWLTK
jgi:hypothetical protein